jgi:CubicO group peptidase (beta-lactamase class C family)
MKTNNRTGVLSVLLALTLFNSACGQNGAGLDVVKEEQKVLKSLVLLNNEKFIVPVRSLETQKIAHVYFGDKYAVQFDSLLNKYDKVTPFNGSGYKPNLTKLTDDLKLFSTVIIQVNDGDLDNPAVLNFIKATQPIKEVIVAYNGKEQGMVKLNDITAPVIWAKETSELSAEITAQAVFGGVAITNKLDANHSVRYRKGMGFTTEKTRLQYTVPESAGINSDNLKDIDALAKEAITQHGTPGLVVLVAKDGKVIFNKAYGYHTYDKTIPDKIDDIFDLASMTKISATTMETMQLVDQGKLNIESTIGDYLPITKNTNKADLKVRELLEHQAGLIADIPTVEAVAPGDHSVDSSAAFPTKVNEGYYLRKDYFKDVMWPKMINSPVRTRGQYVYSDLSMVFMQQIDETLTATPENIYVQKNLYQPLGMQTAGFLPLYRFPVKRIPPTENDPKYRHALLDGYVHDPTAALMGGVAGHAGLFATANDIAVLFEMMRNRGSYGGVQYIKPETVDQFTAKQSNVSRRGLGFDRWDPMTSNHYPSQYASSDTYGHTGFTGTCVWVDPKASLVYVLLSNRVYPDVSSRFNSLSIRPRIQDVIYQAISKGL